jgi:hypothetical protein
MKNLSILIAFITTILSFPLHANPGAWMPEAKKIAEIVVEGGDSGVALILIEGGVPLAYIPPECSSGSSGNYNTIYLNTDKGRSMYSLALAAYMGGKSVRLSLSCTDARPLITRIRF